MTRYDTDRRNRIRADRVILLEEPMIMGGDPARDGCISVTPLLDGDQIHILKIKCSCGQQMSVECIYPEDGQRTETAETAETTETTETAETAETAETEVPGEDVSC